MTRSVAISSHLSTFEACMPSSLGPFLVPSSHPPWPIIEAHWQPLLQEALLRNPAWWTPLLLNSCIDCGWSTTFLRTLHSLPRIFFKDIFDLGHFFFFFLKSSLNLLQNCFRFPFLVFWPWGTWVLSSLTRDQTSAPCIGRQSLNHWTIRKIPLPWILVYFQMYIAISKARFVSCNNFTLRKQYIRDQYYQKFGREERKLFIISSS